MKLMRDLDFSRLPDDTLLIFTDFAAVMALRALETKNSSVDAHCVNDTFVLVWKKRNVRVQGTKKDENGHEVDIDEMLRIFTVDVEHFFAETLKKGKKSDHAMHNVCLNAIITKYKAIFDKEMPTPLRHVIIWTDNAPTQYRCRQNFIKVASVAERHPDIRITHRLAVPDNFKGVWDGLGKDPVLNVKRLEKESTRSPDAETVFVNSLGIEKTAEQTCWAGYEEKGDVKLKGKGKWGMNSRTVNFVVETQEDLDRLAPEYPGKIFLCDRSFIMDTKGHTAIPGTSQLHEVRSTATSVPTSHPRKWPVMVSDLPCNCKHCDANPNNNRCKYSAWRRTRRACMQLECLAPDEAESWVSDKVARNIWQPPLAEVQFNVGTITSFLPDKKQWLVDYDGYTTQVAYTYADLCVAKKLYDDKQ
jgi:hypothetical protein